MNDEKSEFSLYTELLTRLQELEYVINNALGSEDFEAEVNTYKPIKPKVVDVERLAAKAVSSSPSIAKSSRSRKLMPENLIYKHEETEPREDPPDMGDAEMPKNVEDSELPEDSQEKQLELALETALALLRKKKNTLSVVDSEANRVRPPLDS